MSEDKLNIISSSEFGKIFSVYQPRFIAVAYRYVRDMSIAEDLVSDSFMSFWEARGRLAPDVNIPAYILTIVKNTCLNYLNAKLRHVKTENNIRSIHERLLQEDIRSLSVCDPERLFSKEIDAILKQAIESMPEMTRKVFLQSRSDGKTYRQIADDLEISIFHVNYEMRRALDILRTEFKDYLPAVMVAVLLSLKF